MKIKYLMITSDKSVDDIDSDVDENVDIERRRQNVTTQQNKFFKSVEHIRPNLSFFFQIKNVDAISPIVDREIVQNSRVDQNVRQSCRSESSTTLLK